MSPIVLLPDIVSAPAPAFSNVQLYVEPPPTNVLAVAALIDILPVPMPAVVVKLVGAALLNEVVFAAGHNNVPPLKVMFFVPVAVVSLVPTLKTLPFKSTVPLVKVVTAVDIMVKLSTNCQVPPTPLNIRGVLTVRPLDVIVFVPEVDARVMLHNNCEEKLGPVKERLP